MKKTLLRSLDENKNREWHRCIHYCSHLGTGLHHNPFLLLQFSLDKLLKSPYWCGIVIKVRITLRETQNRPQVSNTIQLLLYDKKNSICSLSYLSRGPPSDASEPHVHLKPHHYNLHRLCQALRRAKDESSWDVQRDINPDNNLPYTSIHRLL